MKIQSVSCHIKLSPSPWFGEGVKETLEHLVRILSCLVEGSELGNYLRTVLGIGHAKPLARRVKHFASSLASLDEMIDHERDEELALEVCLVLRVGEECLEVSLAVLEVVGSEAPEVHADGCSIRNADPLLVLVEVLHHAVVALYLGALYDACEQVCLLVVLADTAADGTALAQRVIYAEAHHCILALAACGQFAQELSHHAESITVVEVIAVEHSERLLDDVLAHEDSVVGAPRLLTAFWNGKAFWQSIEALEAEFAGNVTLVLGENLCAELLLEVTTDNPYNLAEAGLNSIIDAVVHNALSLRTKCVELLEAAIAASHTSSQKE